MREFERFASGSWSEIYDNEFLSARERDERERREKYFHDLFVKFVSYSRSYDRLARRAAGFPKRGTLKREVFPRISTGVIRYGGWAS